MKVLINAASSKIGGGLTYISNILAELPAVAGDDRFLVVLPAAVLGDMAKNVDSRIIELMLSPVDAGNIRQRVVFDNWTIPRLIKSHGVDILFSSTGFGTLRSPCPQVLLVPNAAYFCPTYQRKYEELGKSYRSIRFRRWWSVLSMMSADVVLFPSAAMQSVVSGHVSLKKKHTVVQHYGFNVDRFCSDAAEIPEIAGQMDEWRREGYKIVLHVSSYAVHKNLESLVEALPAVIASGRRLKVVTTLDRERTSDKVEFDALKERIRDLGLSDVVVFAGHLLHEQLHDLYRRADVFVFPSFVESFGLPLVEAMACGLPIVASDIAVNREVCGKAAAYFNTFSSTELSSVLGLLLDDEDMRRMMREQSLKRAGEFSWQSYVSSLMKVFREFSKGRHDATGRQD